MGSRRLFQSQDDGFHFNVADGFNNLSGYTSKDLHLQERNKFCQSVLETFEWFSIVSVKLNENSLMMRTITRLLLSPVKHIKTDSLHYMALNVHHGEQCKNLY